MLDDHDLAAVMMVVMTMLDDNRPRPRWHGKGDCSNSSQSKHKLTHKSLLSSERE
jgi:hypothetical protein